MNMDIPRVEGPDTTAIIGKIYWIKPEDLLPAKGERVIVKFIPRGVDGEFISKHELDGVIGDKFDGEMFIIERIMANKVIGWIYEPKDQE
jgi:hypothetical protein